jgi:hypothetical protein
MGAKSRLFAVLALALTIGVVSLVPAAIGAKEHKEHGKKVQILNLTTLTDQQADLDLGASGPSVGDRFVFSENVFRGKQKIGTDGGECVVVRLEPNPVPQGQEPTSVTVNCAVSAQLPKGQLTVQGLTTFSEQSGNRFTLAITGGTGAYRTAHGEATVTDNEDENVPDELRLKIIR